MNNRERARAVLMYEPWDRLPVVHFGYWTQTLEKWRDEGHLKEEEIRGWADHNDVDTALAARLGFDFNWGPVVSPDSWLHPAFEVKVLEQRPDGFRTLINADGVVVLERDGAGSIPAEVGHLLTDRKTWEEHYRPRLQFSDDRIDTGILERFRTDPPTARPLGVYCGSLYGNIRNILGVEGSSYLYADDEELYTEIIDTVAALSYTCLEKVLAAGVRFDFAHFWEDICFKNGPLVIPRVFAEKVGPHYRRITELLHRHGVRLVSLDCDGQIDTLLPIWLENGVNVMFPIEVGTWNASIGPWRARYGKELRGVGGMNKVAFSQDFAAIDREIERLKPLVDLGGYLPCPDHRIAPDAVWDNVRYYCDRMHAVFG